MTIEKFVNPQTIANARSLVAKSIGPVATAVGIGNGINIANRSVTDENLSPPMQALAYGFGGLAGAGKLGPVISKLAPNAALTGGMATGVDFLQKQRRGYSMLDPKSIESTLSSKVEQSLQSKIKAVADRWRSALRVSTPTPSLSSASPELQHSELHSLFGDDVHSHADRLARAYRERWQLKS